MTRRYIALFVACFVVFSVAAMPLSALVSLVNLERLGVAVGHADGTIWHGRLKNVYWRNSDMGEISVRVAALKLLKGEISAAVTVDDGLARARGTVSRRIFSDVVVQDAVLSANVSGLPILLPLSGQVDADIAYLRYGSKGCVDVKAVLKTDALRRGFAGLTWAGPVLTGQARCEGGVLVLPLSGTENGQLVSLQMKLKVDRTFDIRVSIDTSDAAMAQFLPALGFQREGQTWVLVQAGRWD